MPLDEKSYCDLSCPPFLKGFCCRGCNNKPFTRVLKDKFPDDWSDEKGFLGETGCRLGDNRPIECKQYDCHEYQVVYGMQWTVKGWTIVFFDEIHKKNVTQEWCDTMNGLFG